MAFSKRTYKIDTLSAAVAAADEVLVPAIAKLEAADKALADAIAAKKVLAEKAVADAVAAKRPAAEITALKKAVADVESAAEFAPLKKAVADAEAEANELHKVHDVFVLQQRKQKEGAVKSRNGVDYLEVKTRASPGETPENSLIYARDVYIVRGSQDPANVKDDKKDDKKEVRAPKNEVSFGVSYNHSSGYGQVIESFERFRESNIKQLERSGAIIGWSKVRQCAMTPAVYGDQAPKDKVGKPYPDPKDPTVDDKRLTLIFDFSNYTDAQYIPAAYRGKPQCVVKDFKTGRPNPDTGRIEYDLLMVETKDEKTGEVSKKPVDLTNAHQVFTTDSIIKELYISISSTSKSQFGVSTRQIAHEIVIDVAPLNKKTASYQVDNSDLIAEIEAIKRARAKSAQLTEGEAQQEQPQAEDDAQQEQPEVDAVLAEI